MEPVIGLDEIVASSCVGVVAFAVYAWRRYRKTIAIEHALAGRTQRYRSLFVNNPVAVFSLDPKCRFTSANPAALALTGYTEQDLLRLRFLDIVISGERASVGDGFKDLLDSHARRFETTLTHQDGQQVPVAVTTVPMVVDDTVVGVYGLAQDISDRVRAHQELQSAWAEAEAANKLKSVFVANVSHEIRTPLTSVLAATEMLVETALDASQHRLLDRVDRSGRRLLRLVDNLLNFAELESGRANVVPDTYNPHDLVAQVNEWAKRLAADRRLDYTFRVTAPPGSCLTGDTARISQVLRSLIENACKFTESGSVHVHAEVGGPAGSDADSPPSWVRFVVTDSGIGLTDEQQAHVFDSFSQVDGSINRAYDGAGLGLAMCRQTVALMGGSLWVESVPGVGSIFTCYLPQP